MSNSTNDSAERGYLLTREGVILLAMIMDGDVAMHARFEIANVIAAWWQGRLLSRREAGGGPKKGDLGRAIADRKIEVKV